MSLNLSNIKDRLRSAHPFGSTPGNLVMSRDIDLTTGPLWQHFRSMALPAAIGMTFSTLYNVVDVYFAGRISTVAQAGLGISFQVFMLMVALGFGLGTAMSALTGNAIGARDDRAGRAVVMQGISLALIGSLILMFVGTWLAPLLLTITSEPGEYREAANRYFKVLVFALPGFVVAYGANGILQAMGDTRSMQRALVVAFFANVILNPLFIYGVPGVVSGIGFDGIALSTVMSQSGVALYILWRISQSRFGFDWHLNELKPDVARYLEILRQVIPSSFAMLVMIFVGFVIQYYLKRFGASAVAAYGVALRVEQLFLLPAFGLTGALLPIAAQNFGASDPERVRRAFYVCIGIGLAYMMFASPVLWIGARQLMQFFAQDAEVVEIGISYLHVDSVIFPAYLILFALNSWLLAMKKPKSVLLIGLYRQAFAVPLFVWLFVSVWGFGVVGVWYGVAASVLSGLVVSVAVAHFTTKTLVGGLISR